MAAEHAWPSAAGDAAEHAGGSDADATGRLQLVLQAVPCAATLLCAETSRVLMQSPVSAAYFGSLPPVPLPSAGSGSPPPPPLLARLFSCQPEMLDGLLAAVRSGEQWQAVVQVPRSPPSSAPALAADPAADLPPAELLLVGPTAEQASEAAPAPTQFHGSASYAGPAPGSQGWGRDSRERNSLELSQRRLQSMLSFSAAAAGSPTLASSPQATRAPAAGPRAGEGAAPWGEGICSSASSAPVAAPSSLRARVSFLCDLSADMAPGPLAGPRPMVGAAPSHQQVAGGSALPYAATYVAHSRRTWCSSGEAASGGSLAPALAAETATGAGCRRDVPPAGALPCSAVAETAAGPGGMIMKLHPYAALEPEVCSHHGNIDLSASEEVSLEELLQRVAAVNAATTSSLEGPRQAAWVSQQHTLPLHEGEQPQDLEGSPPGSLGAWATYPRKPPPAPAAHTARLPKLRAATTSTSPYRRALSLSLSEVGAAPNPAESLRLMASAALAALHPGRPASARLTTSTAGGGSYSSEAGQAAPPPWPELCFHEVTARPAIDPATGRPAILLTQLDVTARKQVEAALEGLARAQLTVLSEVFPRHIIEFLSHSDTDKAPAHMGSLARSHAQVTVLFMDIVGFTAMSKDIAPHAVLTLLNALFTRFDALCEVHGVQKVDTAGDSYIVACGVLEVDGEGFFQVGERGFQDPAECAHRVMAFATDMLLCAKEVCMPHNGQPVDIRVGIHTGDCVSGLVGTKLPKFSLFGDTMNTASRMESTGRPGRIQVSATTKALLDQPLLSASAAAMYPNYEWQVTRGVQIKGKGVMDTFLWLPPKGWEAAMQRSQHPGEQQ